MQIDINCDLGESYYEQIVGNDDAVFPYITSCNIACGFHGGDPLTIENTIKQAIHYSIRIGAHPSYPDREGFGRRSMQFQPEMLKAIIKYQVLVMKGIVESLGDRLHYVKPHGALYNQMIRDKEETKHVIEAILEVDPNLQLMCLAGSPVEQIAEAAGIGFIAEAFADRRYESNGQLMSRTKKGAVITNAEQAADQVISIVMDKQTKTHDGAIITLHAHSICVHGDNPEVLTILKAIDDAFQKHGIAKKANPE